MIAAQEQLGPDHLYEEYNTIPAAHTVLLMSVCVCVCVRYTGYTGTTKIHTFLAAM